MSASVDWATKVITVFQADLTLQSGTLYELDVDALRLELKALEAEVVDPGAGGMAFEDTHRHNTEVVISGVTYARTFEIINGYTLTFEHTGSNYQVRLAGANNNIADVTNYNLVSVIPTNSAGLINLPDVTTMRKIHTNRKHSDPGTGIYTVYDDDDVSVLLSGNIWEDVAAATAYRSCGLERQDKLS